LSSEWESHTDTGSAACVLICTGFGTNHPTADAFHFDGFELFVIKTHWVEFLLSALFLGRVVILDHLHSPSVDRPSFQRQHVLYYEMKWNFITPEVSSDSLDGGAGTWIKSNESAGRITEILHD
jgi:hypothetical protein